MEYIGVYLIDLPVAFKGYTTKNEDCSYMIIINARLNSEMQIATYDHEIAHINNGDYDCCRQVGGVELIRHNTPEVKKCKQNIKQLDSLFLLMQLL
ncbi:MAG: hypothetical protein RR131_05360 [Anaerovorax sp.]